MPDSPHQAYPQLINTLENELSYTFGGCSVIQGMKGLFLTDLGVLMQDRIHLLYTDIVLSLTDNREAVEKYVDALAQAISNALSEEKILIAVHSVFP